MKTPAPDLRKEKLTLWRMPRMMLDITTKLHAKIKSRDVRACDTQLI